jgi:hypothetical protein
MLMYLKKIYYFFIGMDVATLTCLILFFTLLAIIWYSWETWQLRKWQKRSLQMSIVDLATKIKIANQESIRSGAGQSAYVTRDFPETLRKIYEEGRFDLSDIYIIHRSGNMWKKFYNNIITKIKKNFG